MFDNLTPVGGDGTSKRMIKSIEERYLEGSLIYHFLFKTMLDLYLQWTEENSFDLDHIGWQIHR